MSGCGGTKHRMRGSCVVAVLCLIAACGRTIDLVPPTGDAGDEFDAGEGGVTLEAGPSDAEAGAPDAPIAESDANSLKAMCGNRLCQCSNGEDDDKDGRTDGFDAECTSPYDDDENSFANGDDKPGSPNCADCYFKEKPGSGNDSCSDIAVTCLTLGNTSGGSGRCRASCTASAACSSSCLPRTPNGCDCFGCCLVQHAGQSLNVRLSESCTLGNLSNASACVPCTPLVAGGCYNACDECELCLGKTEADLPDKCKGDAGSLNYTCSVGRACASDGACGGPTEYCLQGCCVPFVL